MSQPDARISLKDHVLDLLAGGAAHLGFEEAVERIPARLYGATVERVAHSPWQILEHLRICQWDLLEYSRDPQHQSPDFPDGLWPVEPAPPNEHAWSQSVAAFQSDLQQMSQLVASCDDLLAQIPHTAPGHTLLRQALIVADHNAYHLGQLVIVHKALSS